ncbi:MAG: glycosyltransferase family 2 protein [Lachnospiraceae bacterium]|nr:glycosyltransferase family 2 protein [Lachnospiraceae bacterium]
MNSDLISIIIPIYNRAAYLDRCITSALNQAGVSTEIILIDDGSTDDSLSICRSYAAGHQGIKVIHQENGGISSARNSGLDAATGDYIFFLDSDDYLVGNALQVLLQALESHGADYVIGNFERVSESGALMYESHMPEAIINRLLTEDDFWKYAENDASYLLFVTAWGKLFKRKIWDTLRFPNVRFAEDEFVLSSIVSQCNRIFVSDCIVYKQALSDTSLVRSNCNILKLRIPESKLITAAYLASRGNYRFALQKAETSISDTCYFRQVFRDRTTKQDFVPIFEAAQNLIPELSPHINTHARLKLFLFARFPYLYFALTKFLYNFKNKR